MDEFCAHISLTQTQQITLRQAVQITSLNSHFEPECLSELPAYMLNRVMMMDFNSRQIPKSLLNLKSNEPRRVASTNIMDIILAPSDNVPEKEFVNPMDVLIYVFILCEPVFRQTFVTQVSRCQLSLPLITLGFPLQQPILYIFALKTLYKDYYSCLEKSTKLFSVVEKKLPIISFIRIGECAKSNKSVILNKTISLPNYFFNRDQIGNTKKRYFLNGTVEIGWLLPTDETSEIVSTSNNILHEPAVILNLRGNASNYPKQINFLGEVSTLIYVFVPVNQCDCMMSEKLTKFHEDYSPKTTYLVYQGEFPIERNEVKVPNFMQSINEISVLYLQKVNLGEDSMQLANNITTRMQNVVQIKISLNDCQPIAKRCSINSDADDHSIKRCQEFVDQIITFSRPANPSQQLASIKSSMLPLQGECWSKWAADNRTQHSLELEGYSSLEEQGTLIKKRMKDTRSKQFDILLNPSPLLDGIITHCRTFGSSGSDFFTVWKLLQNELNSLSKAYLPPLYEKYRVLHKQTCTRPGSGNGASADTDEHSQDLISAAKNIAESSFGIEHIFREFGQIFEAFTFSCNIHQQGNLDSKIHFLCDSIANIVAQLLIGGHAFEILDGDVNHVPINWVVRVLDSLSYTVGVDKRIFVLSVLGTQSTGKSTLLNAMFGANFPVSSGRCTRGVFMQLIEIDRELASSLGYDYVVLLDTEGLRAPEFSIGSSYTHDNELATFAVGLGDATIINMSGEGHSEVQDILQIIVFAFIRMKEIHSKPRCMFVHQNVPDTQAETNLLTARSNLIKTLNKMTVSAAKNESKRLLYTQFSDVIDFNPEEEVYYFPGLFDGEPPFHRISTGYIKKAGTLRHDILNRFLNCHVKKFSTISEWSNRLQNLWKAVLEENFVFSYKNTLEVTSRLELDHYLSLWYTGYIKEMYEWKSENLNQLFNAELNELEDIWEEILSNLRKEQIESQTASTSQEELIKRFFQQHENIEIMSQWKSNTQEYFRNRRAEQLKKIEEDYLFIFNHQKTKKEIDDKFTKCRKEIVGKVHSLFIELKKQGKSLKNETYVNSNFIRIWSQWKSQINIEPMIVRDISSDLQQVFLENRIFKTIRDLQTKSSLLTDTKRYKEFGSQGFLFISTLSSPQHLTSEYFIFHDVLKKTNYPGILSKLFGKKHQANAGEKQFHCLLTILDEECTRYSNNYFSFLLTNRGPYEPKSFHILIEKYDGILMEQCRSSSSSQQILELTPEFYFDFIFYQCCKAIPLFEAIQKQYIQRTSLDVKFQLLEHQLKQSFVSLCKGIETEFLCAKDLAKIVIHGMKEYISDSVVPSFLSLFIKDPSHSCVYGDRASLMLHILKHLARVESFTEYLSYIKNPINYMTTYVQQELKKYKSLSKVIQLLCDNLLIKAKKLVEFYSQECNFIIRREEMLDPTKSFELLPFGASYYYRIKKKVKDISLHDLDVLDIYSIGNYTQFCNLYSQELKKQLDSINWAEWIKQILDNDRTVYRSITDNILECEVQCPFCKELCHLAAGTHEHYCGTFHRPQGIKGTRGYINQETSLEECTSSIRDKDFVWVENTWHCYTDYKLINEDYSSWKILGSDANESKYWQWVLYKFEEEFASHYDMVRNEGISKWSHLTKDEVIIDLEAHYRVYTFRKY